MLGVPRLKEIINVATKIKTPSFFVYLKPDVAEESMLVLAWHMKMPYVFSHCRNGVEASGILLNSPCSQITLSRQWRAGIYVF